MPIVTISRRKEWIFWNKKIEVYIDGKSIGRLEQGVNRKIDLPPGEYKLKLKMRWFQFREHKFNLFNKEEKSFVIQTNYKELLTYVVIIVLVRLINNSIKNRITSFKELTIFILVTCVFLILFSRTRFVNIREEALISY